MPSKISRRKFLYTGAGLAAVAGLGYLTKDYWQPIIQNIAPSEQTQPEEVVENNSPIADFELVKPKYIEPCIGQQMQFTSTSTDPDNDLLSNSWYVNGQLKNENENFSFKPSEEGSHTIKLEVNDGNLSNVKEYNFDVKPEQIYPIKTLDVKYKGIGYFAGNVTGWNSTPTPTIDRMAADLNNIRNDLGCNSIRITGGGSYEDHMIECGKIAIELDYDRIFICPRYMDITMDETVERIGKFGTKVKSLREISEVVVYMVGNEFPLETGDMIKGGSWYGRVNSVSEEWNRIQSMLPAMMRKVIKVCKENYGYGISYAAAGWEAKLVPWSDPAFESIGVNAYVQEYYGWDSSWAINLLNSFKRHRKPIHSTEWGCMSYTGAGKYGGVGALHYSIGEVADEDEQAEYIDKYCKMLNRAKIDGSYYIDYLETGPSTGASFNLIVGKRRKKGYYMYKSYEHVNS